MAKGSTMDWTICKGVRHLPAEQKLDASVTSIPIQDPRSRKCTPVHTDCDRLDYRTPQESRLWHHPNHCGSQVQPGRDIPPLLHHHHQTSNRTVVLPTCVPLVQTTPKTHIQQRPKVHIPFWKGVSKRARHHLEPVNGVSPSNQWTHRKEESMGGAILTSDHNQLGGLGHNVTPRHAGTQ